MEMYEFDVNDYKPEVLEEFSARYILGEAVREKLVISYIGEIPLSPKISGEIFF